VDVAHRARLPVPDSRDKHKYLPSIVDASNKLAAIVRNAASQGKFPLVMGGDHSVAIGSIAGMSSCLRQRNQKLGLIWVDAHADMNTPEISPSGNVHGMPLACCIGHGPRELTHLLDFAILPGHLSALHSGSASVNTHLRLKRSRTVINA